VCVCLCVCVCVCVCVRARALNGLNKLVKFVYTKLRQPLALSFITCTAAQAHCIMHAYLNDTLLPCSWQHCPCRLLSHTAPLAQSLITN
jgi:hypothetical protein